MNAGKGGMPSSCAPCERPGDGTSGVPAEPLADGVAASCSRVLPGAERCSRTALSRPRLTLGEWLLSATMAAEHAPALPAGPQGRTPVNAPLSPGVPIGGAFIATGRIIHVL